LRVIVERPQLHGNGDRQFQAHNGGGATLRISSAEYGAEFRSTVSAVVVQCQPEPPSPKNHDDAQNRNGKRNCRGDLEHHPAQFLRAGRRVLMRNFWTRQTDVAFCLPVKGQKSIRPCLRAMRLYRSEAEVLS